MDDPAAKLLERLNRSRLGDVPDGITTAQMAAVLNVSMPRANSILTQAVRSGLMVFVGKRASQRVDGIRGWVPVYRFVNAASNSKRRRRKGNDARD